MKKIIFMMMLLMGMQVLAAPVALTPAKEQEAMYNCYKAVASFSDSVTVDSKVKSKPFGEEETYILIDDSSQVSKGFYAFSEGKVYFCPVPKSKLADLTEVDVNGETYRCSLMTGEKKTKALELYREDLKARVATVSDNYFRLYKSHTVRNSYLDSNNHYMAIHDPDCGKLPWLADTVKAVRLPKPRSGSGSPTGGATGAPGGGQ